MRAKGREILQRRIFWMEDRPFWLVCTSYVGFEQLSGMKPTWQCRNQPLSSLKREVENRIPTFLKKERCQQLGWRKPGPTTSEKESTCILPFVHPTSVSVIMSLWHSNVSFMTWQCDKFDIVMLHSDLPMSYFSLNKRYTSLKRFTCACQIWHDYVKFHIALSTK